MRQEIFRKFVKKLGLRARNVKLYHNLHINIKTYGICLKVSFFQFSSMNHIYIYVCMFHIHITYNNNIYYIIHMIIHVISLYVTVFLCQYVCGTESDLANTVTPPFEG